MYAIVDIETTGGHASSHDITEIAILVHDGNRVVEEFHSLVNPGREIPLYITALTGINSDMVRDAPYFDELAPEIASILERHIFVAHNVNFDYSFVKHHLKLAGHSLDTRKLCTVRLSRKVFPGLPSYSLGNLCRQLDIRIEQRHRAGGDARATAVLFDKLLQHGAITHIDQMLKKHSAERWLPLQLDQSDIDRLPEGPGIYYFHDVKGKVIYVGKAINISKRVRNHFTHNEPDRKRQNFLRHVASVSFTACVNELEALVMESAEIRRLWPRYNLSQKQPAKKFGLYLFEDNRGYMRLAIDHRKKNLPAVYRFNLLHEGLVMLQKLVDAFELHPKLCYLDRSVFTEQDHAFLPPPAVYNGKVRTALESLDEQLPTMAILDEGKSPGEKLCLLMERGHFYGMGYLPEKDITKGLVQIREQLRPLPDNDFIRNSIYSFAEANPEKVMRF